MTALINLQNFNGSFTCSEKTGENSVFNCYTTNVDNAKAGCLWKNSVFNVYAGDMDNAKEGCPKAVSFDLWTTALAVKIMELRMADKKELWELVAGKGKLFLMNHLANNQNDYDQLLQTAEKYIMTGTNQYIRGEI